VWGTNIEGVSTPGTIGAILWGGGPWEFKPATVAKWETGLSIGDPDNLREGSYNVRFAFKGSNNSSEDVLVQGSGQRGGWTPLIEGMDIRDERGTGDKNSVTVANQKETVDIPVDSVSQQTVRLAPGYGNYETYDYCIVDTSDGSGNTVSDFAIGEPIVSDEALTHPMDCTIPVIQASSSPGAVATIRFNFKRST
jgi:hypothetical protein